jgi:hypothetical protein
MYKITHYRRQDIAVLGPELRAFTLSHSTNLIFFVFEGFFEIASHELLPWAGFEP